MELARSYGVAAAELGVVGLGLVALAAMRLGARRVSYGILAVAVLWSVVASAFRAVRAPALVADVPSYTWVGLAATYLASSLQAAWIGATVVAVVTALAPSTAPATTDRVPLAVLALAALCGVGAALAVPPLAVSAVALGVAGWAARRGGSGPLVVAACGLGVGAASATWRALVLPEAGAAGAIDRAVVAVGLALVAIGLVGVWVARQIAEDRRWGRLALPAALAAAAAAWAWGSAETRSFGPPPELADLDVPIHAPARVARTVGGCLVDAEHHRRSVGKVVRELRVFPCPPDDARPFAIEAQPYLAVPGSAPIAVLTGLHAREVGVVGLLVRADAGRLFSAWRVVARSVPVWAAPQSMVETPQALPLPGSALVWADAGGRRWTRSGVTRVLGGAAEVVDRERVRQDVLIHESAAATVDDWLALCGAAERVHPDGLQCVLAVGPVDGWLAQVGPAGPPPDPDATWETVEGEPEDGFR